CSGRADLSYDEFLRRSVHRGSTLPEASVEVVFRHTVDGVESKWHLVRSWAVGDHVKERFQVFRDDVIDKVAAEHWATQVEEFIPNRIAPLFLFDGEKVERYADLDAAPELIRTAIQNLLGLDIVERLTNDLVRIERRRKAGLATPTDAPALDAMREEIQSMVMERAKLLRQRASAVNELDQLQRTADELDRRYEVEGGSLFQDRSRLEAERAVAARGKEALEKSLREAAAGMLPLAFVSDLLVEVSHQAKVEEEASRNEQSAAVLATEYQGLLELEAFSTLPDAVLGQVRAHLDERVHSLRRSADAPRYLDLDQTTRAAIHVIVDSGLAEGKSHSEAVLRDHSQVLSTMHRLDSLFAAMPAPSSVAELIKQRDVALDALRVAQIGQDRRNSDLAALEGRLETIRTKEARLLENVARARFEQEDTARLLEHSTRVRSTLEKFRTSVVRRHVARIEKFVFECFQLLARKANLVTGLTIDSETFQIGLLGADGEVLTAERLSAGERQLLAIAILWGLARASGRSLPVVIDTPLGRLDSQHRARLVSSYFPFASHQMLLLSTDQELVGDDYDRLMSSVGRSYHLRFDERLGRTVVEPGYFRQEAA
ncbi:MAG: DNA sulfur modification protein DndD, partial [Myxococcales bacterium]|nr:DNA sulfur modification protein DndD [Myxococcales bacterium]